MRAASIWLVSLVLLAWALQMPPGQATLTTNVLVNSNTAGAQRNPAVSLLFHLPEALTYVDVAWDSPEGQYTDIWHSRSLNGGQTFAAETMVIQPASCAAGRTQWFPSVATSNGNALPPIVHVVWTDLAEVQLCGPPGIYYTRSLDGGVTWSNAVLIGGEPASLWPMYGLVVRPQIVWSPIGDFCMLHVIWSAFTAIAAPDFGVWYIRSNDCGLTWVTPPALVAKAWDLPGLVDGYVIEASVSAPYDDANHDAVAIAFAAGSNTLSPNVYWRSYHPASWGPYWQVNDGWGPQGGLRPSIAYAFIPGTGTWEAHIAWEDSRNIEPAYPHDWDIYYAREPEGGGGVDLRANHPGPGERKEQSEPWIALNAARNPRIAWTDWRTDPDGWRDPASPEQEADVYYTESNDNGATFTSPDHRVNNNPFSDFTEQSKPVVAVFNGPSSGDCITSNRPTEDLSIVWHDARFPAVQFDIYESFC